PRRLSSLFLLFSSLAEAAGTGGDAGFRRQAGCPSRIMLEFNDAAPGGMMLSDHAARSNHWRRGREPQSQLRPPSARLRPGYRTRSEVSRRSRIVMAKRKP